MAQVQVLPAWRASLRDGVSPVRDGWQVVTGGEWVQTFKSKREAQGVAAEIERAERVRAEMLPADDDKDAW